MIGLFGIASAARAANECTPAIARIVSVEGTVHVIRAQNTTATKAQLDTDLCPGDSVVVQEHSRAALLLANRTTLRLDQKSTLVLEGVEPNRGSLLSLLYGRLHTLTRTPRPFGIRMGQPAFINANVEGTEFFVAVAGDRGEVGVFEGRVSATTEQGSVSAGANEAVIALRGQAPQKQLLLRPRDAVQWALYYPAVFDLREDRVSAGRAYDAALREAARQYRANDVAGALSALDAVPESARDSPFHVYRAGFLLSVGRVDEAEPALRRALDLDARNADALALLAVIALVRDDKQVALERAEQAVAADPRSSAARIALSYALQAAFRLDDALTAAQRTTELDPGNALAWARCAELQMSVGELNGALASAAHAATLDPQLARTRLVLGFANLVRMDTQAARAAFERAITQDQAEPLARLGLGLARIRLGDLAGGREEIEVAAVLDPGNSLVRSYLGKAYFEEKRDRLAAPQLNLAKSFDRNDPSPWFYAAILEQANNQPVEALREVNKSIELNDNRAVFRSRLLLDEDRATRQVNLASVYRELASDREAVAIAAEAVREDPSNYSAHRFLSESYAARDRHDIARTSELLQAQLLQPLSLNPTGAELPFTDLSLPSASARAVFANEYSSVFERNQIQASVGGLTGNLGTNSKRVLISGLQGPVSASVGYFDYSTDGFRPNSDISHRIWNTFVQFAASPQLSLQAEYRQRHTSQGDVAMKFDPDIFFPRDRLTVEQRSARLGGTYRPTVDSTWIVSAVRTRGTFDYRFFDEGVVDIRSLFNDDATSYEQQYQRKFATGNVVAGGGHTRIRSNRSINLDFTPLLQIPCSSDVEPCDNSEQVLTKQWNGYVYFNLQPLPTLAATVGLSRDTYDDGSVHVKKWNSKLGLRFVVDPKVALRAATFGTMKRSLVTQQTIEPTQIMGFNQFYDDVVGSVSRFYVAAVDVQPSSTTALGAEIGSQIARVGTGSVGPSFSAIPVQTLRTQWLRLDATLRASSSFIVALGAAIERFTWDMSIPTDWPVNLLTAKLPLTMRTYAANGFFGEVVVTGVWQRVRRQDVSSVPAGRDSFAVVDASLGFRLPGRRGVISLDVKNLFESKFSYQDDDFRSTESRLSPFLPVRRILLKASLAF